MPAGEKQQFSKARIPLRQHLFTGSKRLCSDVDEMGNVHSREHGPNELIRKVLNVGPGWYTLVSLSFLPALFFKLLLPDLIQFIYRLNQLLKPL
jgi:hypothetical protein